jgi:hypothetical protein
MAVIRPPEKLFRSLLQKGKSTERLNCRFDFQKRGQLFILPHNETLAVAAVRISNPDRSPARNPPLRRSPNANRLCSDCPR